METYGIPWQGWGVKPGAAMTSRPGIFGKAEGTKLGATMIFEAGDMWLGIPCKAGDQSWGLR